jgi:uncharacterized delta-60 repeat protein
MQLTGNTFQQGLFKPKYTVVALAMVLAPALAHAQTPTGTLDASFGAGGAVLNTDFGASAVAVQPDGKLVAAGAANVNGSLNFAVARYNGDGTRDTSFGTDGRATTGFGGNWERATSVAIQPDGKIVLAGGSVVGWFNDFAVARYNTDGTLDASFGNGGTVLTEFGVSAQAYAMAVQPDGKIVVAGEANIDGGDNFEVVRYNSDGTLDASFGTGGKVTTDFGLSEQGFSYAQGYSLAIRPDGKLVLAGAAYIGTGFDAALARYESNGALDASFGTGGKLITDLARGNTTLGPTSNWMSSVAVLPDGKIIAAGQANIVRGYGFALVRYESDGTLDASFGTAGEVTTDFFLVDQGFSLAQASSLAVLPDGRIVVGGRAYHDGGFHFALAGYNGDGTLDASFGAGGKVTPNFGRDYEAVSSVAVQPDGKTVVAGGAVIARLN